jgi:hypothetical protein
MLEVQNAYYPAMKGLIVAVVRGSDKVERATKAIRTMMARYGIGRENLEQAFAEWIPSPCSPSWRKRRRPRTINRNALSVHGPQVRAPGLIRRCATSPTPLPVRSLT